MYLKRLSLINFKNIGQEEFPLTPGINCFVGDNGAGKTNFIDAIHYLSMCKSAFSMTDTQSVRHGEEFFLLEGSYERSDGRGEQIVCSFARRGGKTLKRNGKEYDRLVGEYYALLSGRREQVELTYRSELAEAPFTELLQRARQRDLANQFTTAGIHRDDLVLRIDGYPLRKYGSQGQQKSFLVALKLAQYRIVGADKGEKPILLLDDLFDKLDMGRVEQLIKLVSGEEFGQIVITDCNKVRLETILGRQGGDYRLYVVANGEIAK